MAPTFKNFDDYYRYVRKDAAVVNKRDLITSKVRDKLVLDLGCIGHSWRRAVEDPNWYHGIIKQQAKESVGLDYLRDDVKKLNELGFTEIVYGDATDFRLNRTFDSVVVGDLIEHVSNLQGLLESIHAHLTDTGQVVITTPNPFYINQFMDILIQNQITFNDEHICWFDPVVLYELLQRHGLQIDEFYWLEDSLVPGTCKPGASSMRHAMVSLARRILYPLRAVKKYRKYFSCDFAVVASKRTASE